VSDDEQTSDTDSEAATNDDAAEEDTAPTTRLRSNKRWKESNASKASVAEDAELSTEASRTTTSSASADKPSTSRTEESDADEAATATAVPATSTTDVAVTQGVVTEPETAPVTKTQPNDAVSVAVSSLVTALVSPFAGEGDEPTAPVDSPAVWTLAAAARREFLGSVPALDTEADPAPNGLVADNVATMAAVVAADEQPKVVAIPQTSLLTPLQYLPIIGPLAVTPVIALLHQIPLIGDILHPIIGYPVGFTGGTTPRDVRVISEDGTSIYVHFFPAQGENAGKPAPTILNGPGLGLPGETNPLAVDNPFLPNQVIGMGALLQNGYNVVTWDPRGEWGSGGILQIDHPEFEGKDMQAIISWVAQQPEAAFDPGSETDPLIGMVGLSYGGGIQLVTAAIDPRVDAIVPTIAWNNINTALAKNGGTKTSWGLLLGVALLLTGSRSNPQIYTALISGLLTGEVSQQDRLFLDERGPDYLLDQITAPTLLVQGTVDTLFSLQEAHDNAIALIANGVETKVVWYCGGHGGCISSVNDGEVIDRATLAWLDKYVKGLPVQTGPQFEWVDQHGENFSSDTYPVQPGTAVTVESDEGGTLPLWLLLGGSGPNFRALGGGPIGALLGILSGAEASNAVELTTEEAETTTYIVGAPKLTFTYSGTGSSSHVYAQLVDNTTGLVLGNQVTPIAVTLDGTTHEAVVDLEPVAHTLAPGETLTVQIVASAVTYQALWSSGRLNVSTIKLTLPTADEAEINLPVAEATAAA
jgi:ABC-2 type transport system ATP-binding protein